MYSLNYLFNFPNLHSVLFRLDTSLTLYIQHYIPFHETINSSSFSTLFCPPRHLQNCSVTLYTVRLTICTDANGIRNSTCAQFQPSTNIPKFIFIIIRSHLANAVLSFCFQYSSATVVRCFFPLYSIVSMY